MICSGRDKIETPEQVCPFISKFCLHKLAKYILFHILKHFSTMAKILPLWGHPV